MQLAATLPTSVQPLDDSQIEQVQAGILPILVAVGYGVALGGAFGIGFIAGWQIGSMIHEF